MIDDGSENPTASICDEYAAIDKRFKAIHIQNGGVSNARNKGLDLCIGEWICFVDSDDYLLPDHLSSLSGSISEKIDVVFGGYKHEEASDTICHQYSNQCYLGNKGVSTFFRETDVAWHMIPWDRIYRASIVKKHNIRFNSHLLISEDRLFCYDFLLHTKGIATTSSVTYMQDISNDNSLSKRKVPINMQIERYKLLSTAMKKIISRFGMTKADAVHLLSYNENLLVQIQKTTGQRFSILKLMPSDPFRVIKLLIKRNLIPNKTVRQSNMELLRIISMLCIIVYHLLLFGLEPASGNTLYKALQIPFHIGVPIFVMISGYFGIRFSFKGLFRLMGMAYVYALLVELAGIVFLDYPINTIKNGIFVIGYNRHWFLTTYLWLYLLSPVINLFLKNITVYRRIYWFVVLALANFYAGHIMQHEPSLIDGKNIMNFMLLYLLGNTIHTYQNKIDKVRIWVFPSVFIMIAVFTTYVGLTTNDYYFPLIGNVWHRFFEYNSLGMYINASLVFMLFTRMKFSQVLINYFSGSVFAMYLLSVSFIWDFVRDTAVKWEWSLSNQYLSILMCIGVAMSFMIFCVIVDKMLTPVWNRLLVLGRKLDDKYQIFSK